MVRTSPTVGEVLAQAAEALAQARAQLARVPLRPRAVHAARQHLKRARAWLGLLRGSLAPATQRRLERTVRETSHALGFAREQHVLRRLYRELCRDTALDTHRHRRWVADLRRRERATLARIPVVPLGKRLTEAHDELRRLGTCTPGLERALVVPCRQAYRRTRKACRRLRHRGLGRSLHRLRQRAQRLEAAIAVSSRPLRASLWHQAIQRLAKELGSEHDLALLEASLEAVPLSSGERRGLMKRIRIARRRHRRRARAQARAGCLLVA